MVIRTVHIFVFDGFWDWGPSYAIAQLNNAFRVLTVAATPAPVLTAGGLLMLPGGTAWEIGGNREAARKAKEFLDAGIPVGAICGAALGLARMGLLDDRYHTRPAAECLRQTGYKGQHKYRDQPAVTHKHLVTANSTESVEFAREILEIGRAS